MTKAEEYSEKEFPQDFCEGGDEECLAKEHAHLKLKRDCFIKGFERAESLLSLTWQDCRKIVILTDILNTKYIDGGVETTDEEFFKAVLSRFKEGKEKGL